MFYSKTIQRLIDIFSNFPTVGPRTAGRFVFYLLTKNDKEIEELINSISALKKVKLCQSCFNPFEGEGYLCQICANPGRNRSLVCLVEKESDLDALEKTKKYKGLYFILGGTVSRLKKEEIKNLRIEELKKRIEKHPEIKEVIIATNPTAEGEATALYLERVLKPYNKKITRLGRGLPTGSELEYADDETLEAALEGRK